MEILRNDTLKEILRGPQGKAGLPGLTVTWLHKFRFKWIVIFYSNNFLKGAPGTGERGLPGQKGDKGEMLNSKYH